MSIETHEIPEYKARFIDEYKQLTRRLAHLQTMLDRLDSGTLDFVPTCPQELLENQRDVMRAYRDILSKRAAIEDITL